MTVRIWEWQSRNENWYSKQPEAEHTYNQRIANSPTGSISIGVGELMLDTFPNDFHRYVELQSICQEYGHSNQQFNGLSQPVNGASVGGLYVNA